MNTLVIVLIAAVCLFGAYTLYGRWLANKWGIDPALFERFRRCRAGAAPRHHAIERVAMRVRYEHKLASGAYTFSAALAPRSSARIIRLSRAARKRVLGRKIITFL